MRCPECGATLAAELFPDTVRVEHPTHDVWRLRAISDGSTFDVEASHDGEQHERGIRRVVVLR